MANGIRHPHRSSAGRRQGALEHDEHRERDELSGDESDVLEAGVESAVPLAGHLAQVRGARTVLAAHAQSLKQSSRDDEQRWREHAIAA